MPLWRADLRAWLNTMVFNRKLAANLLSLASDAFEALLNGGRIDWHHDSVFTGLLSDWMT